MTSEETEWRDIAIKSTLRITQLESTQTRWVPCSERMPERTGEYLVPKESSDGDVYTDFIYYTLGRKWLHVYAWLDGVPEFVPEAKP